MDFAKQCKRFINFNVINHEKLKRKLTNISAVSVIKHIQNPPLNPANTLNPPPPIINYQIVIADNEDKSLIILNEADGSIIKEAKDLNFTTYSICCTNNPKNNFIYLSDNLNNIIRKFDENLKEIKQLKVNNSPNEPNLLGPCGMTINEDTQSLLVVDQKNLRVVSFDLATDEYISEFKLFEEDLKTVTKYAKPNHQDLSARIKLEDHLQNIRHREKLDFWPFGVSARGPRVYVTDWNRNLLYIYKNQEFETKIGARKVYFTRPRDVLIDSLGSMLITDLDQEKFVFFDNKGTYLFETKIPKQLRKNNKHHNEDKGIFGVAKVDNKLIFATNMSIVICNLLNAY